MIPRPGTYGVVETSGPVGWTIQHATASPYSHAFIILDATTVMEGRPGGVGTAHLDKYVRAGAVFNDQEPLGAQFLDRVLACAREYVGTPYDWFQIAALAGRFFGAKHALLPAGRHEHVICSTLVSCVYTNAGRVMFPAADRWTISPRSLADRIDHRTWETE